MRFVGAALAAWIGVNLLGTEPAFAEERAGCGVPITRENLVPCALGASFELRAEQHELEAARARRLAVSPLLPSNPQLSGSLSRRTNGASESTNWEAQLSQELEVGGQRGVRREAATASIDAQTRRVELTRAETAYSAWTLFFELLSAREEQSLFARLEAMTQALSLAAHARAAKGLGSELDADVAEAASLRLLRVRLAAERRLAETSAALAALLGFGADGALRVEGELSPLASVDEALARRSASDVALRPEMQALDAERRAHELRADAYRRSRIPNPTLSAFAQRDGFDERVFGVGLSLPIPLPGNLGRTFVGEIAEESALAKRSEAERHGLERRLRLEQSRALRAYATAGKSLEALGASASRAEASIASLQREVEAGRLTIREVIPLEQALMDLLQSNLEARRARCLASVELARALGLFAPGRAR